MPYLFGNAEAINTLQNLSQKQILSIDVISSASPEGNTLLNKELSADRSVTTMYLLDSLGFALHLVKPQSIGTDWDGLAKRLILSEIPQAEEAASIIRDIPEWIINDGVVVDSRKLRLRKLDNGVTWNLMLDSIFPALRVSHITLVYRPYSQGDFKFPDYAVSLPVDNHTANDAEIFRHKALIYTNKSNLSSIGIRSNLLYDVAAVPNIGLIVPIAKGWSVSADAYYADWSNRDDNRHWRIQGAELAVRKQLMPTPPLFKHLVLRDLHTTIQI